jgi:hypothetical protein
LEVVGIAHNGPSRCKYLEIEQSAEQKVSFHHFLNCDKSPDKGNANKQENYQPSKYSSE